VSLLIAILLLANPVPTSGTVSTTAVSMQRNFPQLFREEKLHPTPPVEPRFVETV
jgi:hypothetical protein